MIALRRFAQIVIPLVTLLALNAPASPGVRAQDGGGWHVESITPLSELISLSPLWALPAPGAIHVTAVIPEGSLNQACVLNLDTAASACVPLPEETGRGFTPGSLPPLVWAPDSQRLAVVGSPLQLFVDNDLTVVDFAAQTATVLAPDETTGSLPIREPGQAIIDVQPAWSSDGTRIAVERTEWSDEERIGRIAIVDAATGGETASLSFPVVSPDSYNFGVTMALAWSPDGASIAWSRFAPNAPADQNGVWLIDVESGESRQIISLADAQPFMSTAETRANAIWGFVWAPDGCAALVWVVNPYEGEQRVLLYDLAAGTLSALPRPDAITETDTDFEAAWSPDGGAVLVSSAVTQADPARMLVQDSRAEHATALWLVDRDAGTSALLGYVPRIPLRSTLGVWSADGGAILSDYRLTLARE